MNGETPGAVAGPAQGGAAPAAGSDLQVREARAIVADLFAPNPLIYWSDFLGSVALFYTCAILYLRAPSWSAVQILTFVVAGAALLRSAIFIHEIVHMRKGTMRGFKLAWNALCGVPLLLPSLMYTSHADHHSNRYYGTPQDGEYLPLGASPRREILLYLAMVPLLPIAAALRFLILAPVSFLHPRLRERVLLQASAAVINPHYRRRALAPDTRRLWALTDAVCFAYLLGIVSLLLSGVISPVTILKLYVLLCFTHGLNWVRTLAAHRYRNAGGEMSYAGQLLDSINLVGRPWLQEIMFPVGLRYHALHHLFPTLPYHALGTAHRRLMDRLPADSVYRSASCRSALAALRQLWRDAAASEHRGLPAMRAWREAH